MSRNESAAAGSGAFSGKGPGWSSHLRQFSRTSVSQTTATPSRSSDTSSIRSAIRSDAQPSRPQARPGRRCAVHISESYGAPDVLLNLTSMGSASVPPGTLMVMTWMDGDRPSTAHAPAKKHDFPDPTKDSTPGSDSTTETQPKRYFFVAKNMPKDVRRTGNVELLVAKHVADAFGLRKGTHVTVSPLDDDTTVPEASHVELSFKDQYLSRSDMWRIATTELSQRTIYKGQNIIFMGTIRAQVTAVFVEGRKVSSAFFVRDTRPIFRSESARYVLFIQMAREMWDFDSDGSGEIVFNKVVNGFLPALFKRWASLKVKHLVTIVLFSRVEYDAGLSTDFANTILQGDYYTGIQSSGSKRPYKDFYRVVITEMASCEWTTILNQLKREFNTFRRDISLHHQNVWASFVPCAEDDGVDPMVSNRVKAEPSLAMYGNVLEAIHLAASQYAHDYIDRDLLRTGISVVVISPGTGVFEVDYNALRRTTEALAGNGIGIDLICLPKMPLHSVPLFRYKNPRVDGLHHMGKTDRWIRSRDSTPRQPASVVGSYQSLSESLSPSKGLGSGLRMDAFAHSIATHDEWCYAIPQWLHVSYWAGTAEEALSYQGIALSALNATIEEEAEDEFTVRCKMYDLQMRSVLETNEIETVPLHSDPLFPASTIESAAGQQQRQGGTDEVAYVPNRRVPETLQDQVHKHTRTMPSIMTKSNEWPWKQLIEFDTSRAKLPVSLGAIHASKSAGDLDESARRQLMDDAGLFGTSVPDKRPTTSAAHVPGRRPSAIPSDADFAASAARLSIRRGSDANRALDAHALSPTRPPKLSRQISLSTRGFGIAPPKATLANVHVEHISAAAVPSPSISNHNRSSVDRSLAAGGIAPRISSSTRPSTPQSTVSRAPTAAPIALRRSASDLFSVPVPSTPSIPIIQKDSLQTGTGGNDLKHGSMVLHSLSRRDRHAEDRDVKYSDVLRAEDAQKLYNSKLRAGALPDLPHSTPPTITISPWLTIVNPCNPDAHRVDDTVLYSRWQHVFPRTSEMRMMKWKALCCPAAVPLTTEYFPTRSQFQGEYQSTPYNIAQNADDELGEPSANREEFLRELIGLRFSQGFQVVVGPAVARAFGQKHLKIADIFSRDQKMEDGTSIFMSVGNTIHQLSCVNGTEVEVNIYSRNVSDTPVPSSQHPSISYRPAIRTLLDDHYESRRIDIATPKPERNWNSIDSYVAGHSTDMVEGLRYWRTRYVLIPIEARSSLAPKTREDSPEEIRLEGIKKLVMSWQRTRFLGSTERRFPNAGLKAGDGSPSDIVYKTEDPSVVIAAELETLPLFEGADGSYRRGNLLSSRNMFQKSSLNMTALAEAMQQPVEKGGVRMQNRLWHFRMHYSCFIGSDMTTWLLDNFEDLETREEAEMLGDLFMAQEDDRGSREDGKEGSSKDVNVARRDRGLFVHVERRHRFRDGQFFYQFASEFAKPAASSGWFNSRKRDQSVPSTPLTDSAMRDVASRQLMNSRPTSVHEESLPLSGATTPTAQTPGTWQSKSRPKVVLSKVTSFDVDQRRRSYRPERVNLHYDRLHNPDNCYHIRLDWMNVTAKLIADVVEGWAREAVSYGLRLVEVPLREACTMSDVNPFRRPFVIKLSVPPPDRLPESFTEPASFATSGPSARFFYQKAILKRLDFVLDVEAASNFPSDVDVTYSWGKPDFKYSQYIHRSGVAIVEITDDGNFILLANRLYSSLAEMRIERENKEQRNTMDQGANLLSNERTNRIPLSASTPHPPLNLVDSTPINSPILRAAYANSPAQKPVPDPIGGNVVPSVNTVSVIEPESVTATLVAFCHDKAGLEEFYKETMEKGIGVAQTPIAAPTPALPAPLPINPGAANLDVVPEDGIPALGLPPSVLRDVVPPLPSPSPISRLSTPIAAGMNLLRRGSVQYDNLNHGGSNHGG